MGLSHMGLEFFKEIANMYLELLGLLLELVLLLLHVFHHVLLRGPICSIVRDVANSRPVKKNRNCRTRELRKAMGSTFERLWTVRSKGHGQHFRKAISSTFEMLWAVRSKGHGQ